MLGTSRQSVNKHSYVVCKKSRPPSWSCPAAGAVGPGAPRGARIRLSRAAVCYRGYRCSDLSGRPARAARRRRPAARTAGGAGASGRNPGAAEHARIQPLAVRVFGKSAGGATGMRMQASSSAAQRPGAVLHRRRQSWSRADRASATSASRCGRAPIFGGVSPMQSSRALPQGTPVSFPRGRPTMNISI